ncbi:MAG: hypothetical protein K0Q97_229 [Bacillota bacterium]|jgi:hypothetical protein|nr:hypothetical protein [Bacillota bacterium]
MKKLSFAMLILFEIILFIKAVLCIFTKQWSEFYLSLLTIVLLLMPFLITYISKKKKVNLPNSFNLVSTIFIFLALYLGEILNFYDIIRWWDLLLHAIFGFYLVIISYHLIDGVIVHTTKTSKKRLLFVKTIFSFSFTVTLGVLWELFEAAGDFLVNSHMVKGGLEDSASDLLVKIIAAFFTSLYYHHKLKNKKR